MKGILTMVLNLLPEAYRKTKNKLDAEQFIAVLQGITGFAAAIKGKDPLGFIDSAVGIMDHEINKPCLKSLGTIRKNLKKWLTFGKEYKPLKDSSDLNFDKVKVSAIPEVMKVRLTNICLKTNKILSRGMASSKTRKKRENCGKRTSKQTMGGSKMVQSLIFIVEHFYVQTTVFVRFYM